MSSELAPQSFLSWMIHSLGFYALLIPFVSIVSFILTLAIVIRGRGPMAVAALLLIVHMPFLIGIFSAIDGITQSLHVIATCADTSIVPEIGAGLSVSLLGPLVAMFLMVPSYLTAMIGAFIRAIFTPIESAKSNG